MGLRNEDFDLFVGQRKHNCISRIQDGSQAVPLYHLSIIQSLRPYSALLNLLLKKKLSQVYEVHNPLCVVHCPRAHPQTALHGLGMLRLTEMNQDHQDPNWIDLHQCQSISISSTTPRMASCYVSNPIGSCHLFQQCPHAGDPTTVPKG